MRDLKRKSFTRKPGWKGLEAVQLPGEAFNVIKVKPKLGTEEAFTHKHIKHTDSNLEAINSLEPKQMILSS